MNQVIYWAKKYLTLGWSIVPIPKSQKFPAIKWKEYQTRFPTEKEVMTWFSNPLNQIGIVTGSLSKLTVIDADNLQAYKFLASKEIRSSITVKTKRGYHLYFKYCPDVQTVAGAMDNVDIRNDGGIVVAPPSGGYHWLCPNLDTSLLPSLPDGLFREEKIQTPLQQEIGKIANALRNLKNGNRDNTFVSLIGRMRRDGYTSDDIMEMLRPHADRVEFNLELLREKIDYAEKTYPIDGQAKSITVYSTRDHWKEYEERKASKESPDGPEIRTGYVRLDSMLYGLRRGELYTIGARTGIGKTSFCINISSNLIGQNKRVLFLSTEMSYDTIWDRLSRINASLRERDFFTSDVSSPTKPQIEQMIKEVNPDVVIFDHIQHIGSITTNRYQELGKFTKDLKDLARERNISILVASQLNRAAEGLDRNGLTITPQLYHLKECGVIEEESSVVLLFHREGLLSDGTDFYILNIAKNRYGECGKIDFSFNKKTGRMLEA